MSSKESSISVIMNVYNQARELEQNLPAYLKQEYAPSYRVIIVNESSTDETEEVLKQFKQEYQPLYYTFLPKPNASITRRRLALTIGVKAAETEWVIISDILLKPEGNNWIKTIIQASPDDASVVLGYQNAGLTRLQAFSTLEEATTLIQAKERKKRRSGSGGRMKYLKGQYDFMMIRRDQAHEALKYYDAKQSFTLLMSISMKIMWSNLRQRSATIVVDNSTEESTPE